KIAAATGGAGTRANVVALAFDGETFDPASAGKWAAEHGFSAKATDCEQDDAGLLFQLQAAPKDADCATVMLAEGVAAVGRKDSAAADSGTDPSGFTSRMRVGDTATLQRRTPPLPERLLGMNLVPPADKQASEQRVVALVFDKTVFADVAAVRKWI